MPGCDSRIAGKRPACSDRLIGGCRYFEKHNVCPTNYSSSDSAMMIGAVDFGRLGGPLRNTPSHLCRTTV